MPIFSDNFILFVDDSKLQELVVDAHILGAEPAVRVEAGSTDGQVEIVIEVLGPSGCTDVVRSLLDVNVSTGRVAILTTLESASDACVPVTMTAPTSSTTASSANVSTTMTSTTASADASSTKATSTLTTTASSANVSATMTSTTASADASSTNATSTLTSSQIASFSGAPRNLPRWLFPLMVMVPTTRSPSFACTSGMVLLASLFATASGTEQEACYQVSVVIRLPPGVAFTSHRYGTSVALQLWSDSAEWVADDFCKTAALDGAFSVQRGNLTPASAQVVFANAEGTLEGSILGLAVGMNATLQLGTFPHDRALHTTIVCADTPSYTFRDVLPARYFLSVNAPGYETGRSRTVLICPAQSTGRRLAGGGSDMVSDLIAVAGDNYKFTWQADESRAGYQTVAFIANPPVVVYLDQQLPAPADHVGQKLFFDYNILLADDEEAWSTEHSYRLLEMLKTIPQTVRNAYGVQDLPASKWTLTNSAIPNDIAFPNRAQGALVEVKIAAAAFAYASPAVVSLDGVRGTFFSERLHHAAVRFVTNNGEDVAATEKIFKEHFGVSLDVTAGLYLNLTVLTTHETINSFQAFYPEEKMLMLSMMEELPQGFHKITGLNYFLRRKVGVDHPLYPEAPAVGWTQSGYIEWMDTAFHSGVHSQRLILHEKAHVVWAKLLDQGTKDDWAAVGGWSEQDGVWSTSKTTEFVSAYAHGNNPDEDFAVSISYYVVNPAMLLSRSPSKYAFVRDRVMKGYRYVAKIRKDLTFVVLNMFPDYVYPGKIQRVDLTVFGAQGEGKSAYIRLELQVFQGSFSGATHAYMRIFSEIGTWVDTYVYPIRPDCECSLGWETRAGCYLRPGTGHVLCGMAPFARTAKRGMWRPKQIVVTDEHGNQRFEGQGDFGWQLWIDAEDDTEAPAYVPGSLSMSLLPARTLEGHSVQDLVVDFNFTENMQVPPTYQVAGELQGSQYASLACVVCGQNRLQGYGPQFSVNISAGAYRAEVRFLVTEFAGSGQYESRQITLRDAAANTQTVVFSGDPGREAPVSVNVTTSNPDTQDPKLDISAGNLTIAGAPTNAEAPNGETHVVVKYRARDDKSGLGVVSYRLLDPQGISHFQYHYHSNFYTTFFEGDPTAWTPYEIHVALPVGSAPGTWGLQEITLWDKAGNDKTFNFVETHFSVESQGRRLFGAWEMPVRLSPSRSLGAVLVEPLALEPTVMRCPTPGRRLELSSGRHDAGHHARSSANTLEMRASASYYTHGPCW